MSTEIAKNTEATVTRTGPYVTPAVDIYRSDTGWLVRADLPGVVPEDLSVDVNQGRLTIEAPRGDASEGDARSEIGGYRRNLLLPDIVDTEGIEARLVDGVLELTIPRDTRGRTRRITVKAG